MDKCQLIMSTEVDMARKEDCLNQLPQIMNYPNFISPQGEV